MPINNVGEIPTALLIKLLLLLCSGLPVFPSRIAVANGRLMDGRSEELISVSSERKLSCRGVSARAQQRSPPQVVRTAGVNIRVSLVLMAGEVA